jgi:low temperature requirement protein LtrA
MRQRAGEEQRATTLELFSDLVFVFVFAVTQLSRYLLHHLTVQGAAQKLFCCSWCGGRGSTPRG